MQEKVPPVPGAPTLAPRRPRLADLPPGRLLGWIERFVFSVLCDYANASPDAWPAWIDPKPVGFVAWPSVPTIAERTALGERAVQYALKKLVAGGAVECVYQSKGGAPRKPRPGERARPGRSNCYLLTPHRVDQSEQQPETPNGVHPSVSIIRNVVPDSDSITPTPCQRSDDEKTAQVVHRCEQEITVQEAHRSEPITVHLTTNNGAYYAPDVIKEDLKKKTAAAETASVAEREPEPERIAAADTPFSAEGKTEDSAR